VDKKWERGRGGDWGIGNTVFALGGKPNHGPDYIKMQKDEKNKKRGEERRKAGQKKKKARGVKQMGQKNRQT